MLRSPDEIIAHVVLIVLAAVTTQIGTLQVAPVAVAVLTAYLTVSGSGALAALRQRARATVPSSSDAAHPGDVGASAARSRP